MKQPHWVSIKISDKIFLYKSILRGFSPDFDTLIYQISGIIHNFTLFSHFIRKLFPNKAGIFYICTQKKRMMMIWNREFYFNGGRNWQSWLNGRRCVFAKSPDVCRGSLRFFGYRKPWERLWIITKRIKIFIIFHFFFRFFAF